MADAVEDVQAPPVQRFNNNSKERVTICIIICIGLIFALSGYPIFNIINVNESVKYELSHYYSYPISHICRNDSCIIDSSNFNNNQCVRNIRYCDNIEPTCSYYIYLYGPNIFVIILGILLIIANIAIVYEITTINSTTPLDALSTSFMSNCFYFGFITFIYYLVPVRGTTIKINPINHRGIEYINCEEMYSVLNMFEPFNAALWKIIVNGIYILSMQGLLVIIESK